uniref:Uncharacterized protein n=1 Tax=Rhizophora mucronata TaxID=61149 RepID=A0A2P2NB16_RHIMU
MFLFSASFLLKFFSFRFLCIISIIIICIIVIIFFVIVKHLFFQSQQWCYQPF